MSFDGSPVALAVRGVGKTYRIKSMRERPPTLTEALLERLRHPFDVTGKQDFAALSDVSFDLMAGESLGVIGRNGAGKSTLLKILSRVTEPTSGTIDLYGKVGSLLEVGTGFHPELTGRENIFLNGAILGMGKKAIRDAFDSIVDFAEIGQFLDTPVKRYSSGMYVRLAFAVAAHLDPDILIVDEVLAVGDVQFQRKCLGKMGEVTKLHGRGVLFVSHNMVALESLCPRSILLEHGRVVFDGDTRSAIQRYVQTARTSVRDDVGVFDLHDGSDETPILRRVEVQDADGACTDSIPMGEGLRLVVHAEGLKVTRMISIKIATDEDTVVAGVHNQLRPLDVRVENGMVEQVVVAFPTLPLLPGRYWIQLTVSEGRKGNTVVEHFERGAHFDVLPRDVYGGGWSLHRGPRFGVVMVDPTWEMRSNGTIVATSRNADATSPRS